MVWGLALSGVVMKSMLLPRFDRVTTAIYVVMGWLICVAVHPMMANVSVAGLLWLFVGGLFYTGGVAFYLMKNVKFAHFIWHLFVMAGSLSHVAAVIFGVLKSG